MAYWIADLLHKIFENVVGLDYLVSHQPILGMPSLSLPLRIIWQSPLGKVFASLVALVSLPLPVQLLFLLLVVHAKRPRFISITMLDHRHLYTHVTRERFNVKSPCTLANVGPHTRTSHWVGALVIRRLEFSNGFGHNNLQRNFECNPINYKRGWRTAPRSVAN